jgi:hypothetical protein
MIELLYDLDMAASSYLDDSSCPVNLSDQDDDSELPTYLTPR